MSTTAPGVPATLFHYTDAAGIFGILEDKALWGTSLEYMNDASELTLAMDMLAVAIRNRADGEDAHTARYLLDLAERLTPALLEYDPDMMQRVTACAISFCTDGDLLSQWRAYGTGSGYALGLRTEDLKIALEGSSWRLERCRYDTVDQQALLNHVVEDLIRNIRINTVNLLEWFWPRVLDAAAFLP